MPLLGEEPRSKRRIGPLLGVYKSKRCPRGHYYPCASRVVATFHQRELLVPVVWSSEATGDQLWNCYLGIAFCCWQLPYFEINISIRVFYSRVSLSASLLLWQKTRRVLFTISIIPHLFFSFYCYLVLNQTVLLSFSTRRNNFLQAHHPRAEKEGDIKGGRLE
jgi:hypothetical protein